VVVVAGCEVDAEVVAGFVAVLPNKPPAGVVLVLVPNRFEPAVLAVLGGGAPAGVVDAMENKGLAGVVVSVAGVVGVDVLLPKRPEPVFANKPPAAGVGVAVGVLLASPPNKPPVADGVDASLLPKRPPVDGAVLVVAPPNKPPPEEEVAVLVPPKRPPVAGVVEAPPNRPPAEVVGVEEDEAAADPKSPPEAGFWAALL
jgi:hypothetical protein